MIATFPLFALPVLIECFFMSTAVLIGSWLVALCFRTNAGMRHLIRLLTFAVLLLTPLLVCIVPARTVPAASGRAGSSLNRPGDWAPVGFWLFGLWIAGTVVITLQGVVAACGVRVLRLRSAECILDSPDTQELARRLGLKSSWELRRSTATNPRAPMTWGFLHSTVLLPRESDGWSTERLEVSLLHELAHVRRRDALSQYLAYAACTLYWFHPGVWLCARAMRAEAELAVDDEVLLCGVRPSAYATVLLHCTASLGRRQSSFAGPALRMVQNAGIETRIHAILDPDNRPRKITSKQTWNAVAVANLVVLLLVSLRPATSIANDRQTARSTEPVARGKAPPSHPISSKRKAVREMPVSHRVTIARTPPPSVANSAEAAAESVTPDRAFLAPPVDMAEIAKQDAENAQARAGMNRAQMAAAGGTETDAALMKYKSWLDAANSLRRREGANR